MKTILTAIIVLLVVTAAFAGDTTVKFSSPTIVNGTKIAAGEYTVHYDIKGKTADVKLIQNQKTVATTTGTVVETKDKAQFDGIVRENKADGTALLKEIQISNKKQIIRFEDAGTAVGK
jgi:hypothetical protein